MTASAKPKPKLDLIQIFRGLAALIVVLHHITASNGFYFQYLPFNNIFKAGWNGVDFFFVLSGFIITYVHYKDLGHQNRIPSYLTKRIIRIYPPYWIFAIISTIFYFFIHTVNTDSLLFIVKSFFLVPQDHNPVLDVGWSLVHEIVFYILFAIYIFGGFKVFITGLACTLFSYLLIFFNHLFSKIFLA